MDGCDHTGIIQLHIGNCRTDGINVAQQPTIRFDCNSVHRFDRIGNINKILSGKHTGGGYGKGTIIR